MQQELSSEKGSGRHLFEGILNRVDDGRAVATTVSFVSSKDFDLHQYPEAESAALQQLETGEKRAIKQLGGTSELGCARVGGFLSTVLELVNDAVDGKPAPITLCYVFNARHYTATLLSTRAVAQRSIHYVQRKDRKTVEYSQQNLREARFQILGKETRSNSYFEILLGAEGGLRAAPMQISYQPNWWFQVILNLTPSSLHALEAKTSRSSTLPARLNATEASPLPLARNALSASKQQSHHLVNVRESCAALTQ